MNSTWGPIVASVEAALARAKELTDRACGLDPDEVERICTGYQMDSPTCCRPRRTIGTRTRTRAGTTPAATKVWLPVLFADPRRRKNRWPRWERARAWIRSKPAYDVTKAVFLFYGRGDAVESKRILRESSSAPQYVPGLFRLGELSS